MTPDIASLIHGYLDETLNIDQQKALGDWLKLDPDHAREFAAAVLLHDRLRGELLAMAAFPDEPVLLCAASDPDQRTVTKQAAKRSPIIDRRYSAVLVAACALLATAIFWRSAGETPALASTSELRRLIAANAELVDRTYQVNMENEDPDILSGKKRPPHHPPHDRGGPHPRPPHGRPPGPVPPMNGALLYVRGGRQFVLVRKGLDGRLFTTGSNGKTSWSVSPDGPVRVSDDLNRFARGVPGQHHSVPLINLREGLEGLLSAYTIDIRESPLQIGDEVCQQLVAARRSPSHRGPRRVEITYSANSGHIQDMVFVDMPRAQQLPVIIHLQLLEERDLGADFFDHRAHHEPGRAVHYEE